MKLHNLIRKKFMPPCNLGGYAKNTIQKYCLIIGKNNKFSSQLHLEHGNITKFHYPTKDKNYTWFKPKNFEDNDIEWFDTPEEAREASWENFDANYSSDMAHKEIG